MDFQLAVFSVPAYLSGHAMQSYLNDSLRSCPSTGKQHVTVSKDDLWNIIDNADVDIYLHPIISLTDDTVAGYEALARGPLESAVFNAPDLFGTASYYGFQDKLEIACITKALDKSMNLRDPYWITINVSPHVLASSAFLDIINRTHLSDMLHRIIFEITEYVPIQTTERLVRTVHHLKDRGVSLALDDTGCGFAHLETIKNIPFKIVKLCITVTSRIGKHPDIIQDISRTVDTIHAMGGVVLGEGVEQKEQIDVFRSTGVLLAQGFYYGQPRHIDQVLQL
jgi:EAL domain-containing protein (putative c-di-GMP-specific phosphodiesterase class I)